MEFRAVQISEIPELSAFASAIVKQHFDPIIGAAQNDYMISRFQSPEAIEHQMTEGYQYYWGIVEKQKAGFFAFYPKEGRMYLSKFYLHSDFRGLHLATEALRFIESETKKNGMDRIFLNVNRDNCQVIQIYEHLGFVKIREEKNNIGAGYYMDDFVLEYEIT